MDEMGDRLRDARRKAGLTSAMGAAKRFGWTPSTYAAHENGQNKFGIEDARKYGRAFKVSPTWLIAGDGSRAPEADSTLRRAPVMGYVGAGALIEPDYEQVPPEGLDDVELPFQIPEGIIAFAIRGESMRPVYKGGDVILVWSDQRYATEAYLGEDVVVKTADGRRFLKELQRGKRRGSYDLYSHNDRLIEGVEIEWVGEVYVVVKFGQLARLRRQARATSTRRARTKSAETAGMDELPLSEDAA